MRAPSPPPASLLRRASAAAVLGLLVGVPFAHAQEPAPPGTKVFSVPSGAMEPTIRVGQNIRVALFPRTETVRPAVGSVVVLHPPIGALGERVAEQCATRDALRRGMPCPRSRGGRSDEVYVKRIVAGPGDTIAVRRGAVLRNGSPVPEPYTKPTCAASTAAGPCNLRRAIRLGPNRYFLMGDNRGESNDSRFWGPVPRAWMVGVVTEIGVPAPRLFR